MVFKTTGHFKALTQYIPIPSRLFWADLSVNVTGMEGSIFVVFLIAFLRLEIIIRAAKTHGALENTFIFPIKIGLTL